MHNYPRSQHTGPLLLGSEFAPEPSASPNRQALANALRGGSNIMQRDLSNISLTQEEELQVRMLMQQGMSREQAIQSLPRMQHGG
jgi:hypothetical protein